MVIFTTRNKCHQVCIASSHDNISLTKLNLLNRRKCCTRLILMTDNDVKIIYLYYLTMVMRISVLMALERTFIAIELLINNTLLSQCHGLSLNIFEKFLIFIFFGSTTYFYRIWKEDSSLNKLNFSDALRGLGTCCASFD